MDRVLRLAAPWLAAVCLAGVLWHARPLAAQSLQSDNPARSAVRAANETAPLGSTPWRPPDQTEETAAPGVLRVVYPAGGELLRSEAVALARSSGGGAELERVQFYLEVADTACAAGGCLVELGSDADGANDWSVSFSVADLDAQASYRLLALGIGADGQVVSARGDWFSVWPEQSRTPWVQAPVASPLRGYSLLAALPGNNAVWPSHLAFYLSPLPQALSDTLTQYNLSAGAPYYVGSYGLALGADATPNRWRYLPFDTRAVPDGDYLATAIAVAGSARYTTPAGVVVSIRNDDLPQVQVITPDPAVAVRDTLAVSAEISASTAIQRVDFLLEFSQPTLPGADPLATPDGALARVYWLGSDLDGSDGWGVRASVEPFWDGDDWYVRAVAVDAQGRSQSARSEEALTIRRGDLPHVRLLRPSGRRVLRGEERVTALVGAEYPFVEQMALYLQDESGQLTPLGQLQPDGRVWTLNWRTASHPDGHYRLLLVATDQAGRQSEVTSELVTLRNQQGFYRFRLPGEATALSGDNLVEVVASIDSPAITALRVDCRDAGGTLWPVGEDTSADGGWLVGWPTARYPDGDYTLTAQVTAANGSSSLVTRTIAIRNLAPSLTLEAPAAGDHWSGARQIAWTAEHPQGAPLAVTLEYSPDGGRLWFELAREIAGQSTYEWDTTAYPDGAQGLLRITAQSGNGEASLLSAAFVVDNINDAPGVTLLAPSAGTVDDAALAVTWAAWDPDGDPVAIDLDYRLGDGPWQTVAHGLDNTGTYRWRPTGIAFGQNYALRITAVDPGGATATDTVSPIRFQQNHTPEIELLWPKNRIRVEQETVILWKSSDADGDALTIDIYYSDNAGQAWLPLAEGLENTGYYVWQVSFLPTGGQYRVRVVARDGLSTAAAESNGVFLVGQSAQPQVTLFSPDPLVPLRGWQLLRWSAPSPGDTALQAEVQVRAARDGEWQTLAVQPAEVGFYLWDTTPFADGEYELRLAVRAAPAAGQAEDLAGANAGEPDAVAILAETVTLANGVAAEPTVRLLTPHGGELWSGLQEITWEAGHVANVPLTATVAMSADAGVTWQDLAVVPAQTGRIVWDVASAPPVDQIWLRVQVSDAAGLTATDVAPGPVYLTGHNLPPHVIVALPPETDLDEPVNVVAWGADDADGDALSVSLALSTDDGVTWRSLDTELAATGRYTLTTATDPQTTYRARVTASDGIYAVSAVSPSFQGRPADDAEAPELRFEEMDLDVTWSRAMPIRWWARHADHDAVRIDLAVSDNGGRSWSTVARNLENTGVYAWDTTTAANGTYLLQVTAHTAEASSTVISEPVAVFNLGGHVPSISILSPRGGETWAGPQEIRWAAHDADGDTLTVSLAYSIDRGANWKVLADGIQDASGFIWDTTTIPNCAEVWLRAMISDGRFRTYATAVGPFAVHNAHAPWINLLAPTEGGVVAGECEIVWRATSEAERPTRVYVEISSDGGNTWDTVSSGLPSSGSYRWTVPTGADGGRFLLRVAASDGRSKGIATLWQPLVPCSGLNDAAE